MFCAVPVGNHHLRSLGRVLGVISALLLLALSTSCTTRTAGMQSPLAHDHDGLQWRPLDNAVSQAFIIAPAYTALVENDPGTGTDVLRQRIEALPDDVRDSQFVELRVAIRPAEGLDFDRESRLVVRGGDASVESVTSKLVDLTFDGDWAVVSDLPPAGPGEGFVIELWPGSAATGWEYGFAPGRVPYGGSPAVLEADSRRPVELSGSLGFQTIFDQNTDLAGVASSALHSVADGLIGDAVLLSIYAGLLVAGASLFVAYQRQSREAARDGR